MIPTKLGVQISESKSITSHTGCIEFAKRFWVKSSIGLGEKYNVSSMNVLQRLAGAGYRVRSRLMSTHKAVRRKLQYQRMQLPIDLWLGRGMPLNPY